MPSDEHYDALRAAVPRGEVTIFYGAGINIPQKPDGRSFDETANYCPTGTELALYLARKAKFPTPQPLLDLQKIEAEAITNGVCPSACEFNREANRLLAQLAMPALAQVAEYAQTMEEKTKYKLKPDLHALFNRAFPSTAMHDLLAELPSRSQCNRLPVFITTNYDTVLERALAAKGEPFDILFYRAPGPGTPVWLYHWQNAHQFYTQAAAPQIPARGWDGMVTPMATYGNLPIGDGRASRPRDIAAVAERARTLIVKIHGTVAPDGHIRSSFVISESDYIQFLSQVSAANPLPDPLISLLKESHFLFLGYGLADWNILALCQQLWKQRILAGWENWAVQFNPSDYDVARWSSESATAVRRVEVFNMDIAAYAQELRQQLG